MRNVLLSLGRRVLSKDLRRRLLRWTRWPRVNHVDFGDLRRLAPLDRNWGGGRGRAIDRYYIEAFLAGRATDIQGRVLEVGDNSYTVRFGSERVALSEVVHASAGNPEADYVADFADAPQLPSDAFDCVIFTQTLQLLADLPAAVATLHRILKPGGVALVTVPGISQIYRDPVGRWPDYWRFTRDSAHWLFQRAFRVEEITVQTYGNVLTASAFLYGLAQEELTPRELQNHDPQYPMVISVRAQKGLDPAAQPPVPAAAVDEKIP